MTPILMEPGPRTLDAMKGMFLGPEQREFKDQSEFNRVFAAAKAITNATGPDMRKIDPSTWEAMAAKGLGIGPAMFSGAQQRQLTNMLSAMQNDLAKAGIDMGKEIDFSSFADAIPSATAFNVFDLSGPARITAPFMAPFRAKVPRDQGAGPAALATVVTGFTGSATGGVGSTSPFFSLNVPTAGSSLESARGNPISYDYGSIIVPYAFSAIRDAVTMPAQFSAEGFQDLRGMSSTLGMQSAFMLEDRALLMARTEVLATPGQPTGTARDADNAEVGIVGVGVGGTNVYAKITAIGPFGETAGGTASAAVNIAVGVTKVIDFTWADVTGALGYNVYVAYQDAGATSPTTYYRDYVVTTQQSSGFNKFTVGSHGRVDGSGTVAATPTVPAADTGTGSSIAYRGLIQTVEEGPLQGTQITGYSTRLNAAQAGTDITWAQEAFQTMWQDAKADPEEIIANARDIKNMSQLILSGTSSNYRMTLDPNAVNGIVAGVAVSSLLNETTQRVVRLMVHPWLPFGNAVICSYRLPFPTAFGKTTTMEVRGPQDYMQIMWPLVTLRWEWSIIWMNALIVYAPTFFGVVHGIAQSDTSTVGPIC